MISNRKMKTVKLTKILEQHDLWLKSKGKSGTRADFRHEQLFYDLIDVNLSKARFSGANLHGCNLNGANLSGADFSGTDLSGAVLRNTDLREANLSGVHLYGADLFNCKVETFELYKIHNFKRTQVWYQDKKYILVPDLVKILFKADLEELINE